MAGVIFGALAAALVSLVLFVVSIKVEGLALSVFVACGGWPDSVISEALKEVGAGYVFGILVSVPVTLSVKVDIAVASPIVSMLELAATELVSMLGIFGGDEVLLVVEVSVIVAAPVGAVVGKVSATVEDGVVLDVGEMSEIVGTVVARLKPGALEALIVVLVAVLEVAPEVDLRVAFATALVAALVGIAVRLVVGLVVAPETVLLITLMLELAVIVDDDGSLVTLGGNVTSVGVHLLVPTSVGASVTFGTMVTIFGVPVTPVQDVSF